MSVGLCIINNLWLLIIDTLSGKVIFTIHPKNSKWLVLKNKTVEQQSFSILMFFQTNLQVDNCVCAVPLLILLV